MNQNKLSADPLSLVLGIIALVIGIAGCCCYGITAIVPLILGIIGLVTANKSLRDYRENPDVYSHQSRSNVNTAKIINIIAIVMNGVIVLIAIAAITFYGTMLSSGIFEEMQRNSRFDDLDDYEVEIDTSTWESDNYELEIEQDSVNIETLLEEELETEESEIN
ncbi:CCC motif membrane protein [Winogradskyella sp. PE311]|uniref:CCC motif membrane protein n=1 Tax=Winogradskyella sp. PE311 TaxID=3366943 RepID=UPI00397E9658